ncbi:hypothetical protein EKG38_03375 [Shewanella canadensis]|uniref:Uncharacterized protein n=1 Tax=Shewanella canadensis TaxID=271096 RepID=A0A431WZN8_9GAMM|nr:hypothetical protein [Shewanella canadensis]RTR40964.1 hypothetical protein EKG38_03375 [Shewanella canadensis]
MRKLLVAVIGMASLSTTAGFDEKVAASFAGKYEVCAKRLGNKPGYKLKAGRLKAEANSIHIDQIGDGGYLKALDKAKKKAWKLSLKKCKKIADRL